MTSRSLPISELVTLVYLASLILVFSLVGCTAKTEQVPKPTAITASAPRVAPSVTPSVVTPIAPAPAVVPVVVQEVTYDEAETAYLERDFVRATELFTRYTDRKPSNPWGHYMLGLSAWKSGELDVAEVAFQESIHLDSSHVKSWQNLSRVLLDDGRPAEAHFALKEAEVLDPGQGITFRLHGRAFYQEGELELAADMYRDAIRVDDTDAWSMNNLGLLLLDERLFDQASMTLARAVQLRPNIASFQNNLGMALENVGQIRAAERAYAEAVQLDSSHLKANANLTRIMAVEQALELAEADLEELASRFCEEIDTWRDEDIAREMPVETEPEVSDDSGGEIEELFTTTAKNDSDNQ